MRIKNVVKPILWIIFLPLATYILLFGFLLFAALIGVLLFEYLNFAGGLPPAHMTLWVAIPAGLLLLVIRWICRGVTRSWKGFRYLLGSIKEEVRQFRDRPWYVKVALGIMVASYCLLLILGS